MQTASWIIRNKETGEVIAETFKANVAAAVNADRYEAVPVQMHLAQLNQKLREQRA